jgi:hypothetical protein
VIHDRPRPERDYKRVAITYDATALHTAAHVARCGRGLHLPPPSFESAGEVA